MIQWRRIRSLWVVTVYPLLELWRCVYEPVACECADQLCRVSLNPCCHYHQQSRQHPPFPLSTGLPGFAFCCKFRSLFGSRTQTSWFLLHPSQWNDINDEKMHFFLNAGQSALGENAVHTQSSIYNPQGSICSYTGPNIDCIFFYKPSGLGQLLKVNWGS